LLKNCSADILKEISEQKIGLSFNKGERLLIQGGEAKNIYCIRSGVAKTEVSNARDRSLILRLEGKGAILGLRATEKKDRQPLTVTAVENLQVCQLNADKFRSVTTKCHQLRSEIMNYLLSEIRYVEMRALSMVNNSVKERIAEVLLHIAEVYHYRQGGSSIHVHLDRKDIADLAGTTKEQVSRIMAELRHDKLINFRAKHFKYFDIANLKNMTEARPIMQIS